MWFGAIGMSVLGLGEPNVVGEETEVLSLRLALFDVLLSECACCEVARIRGDYGVPFAIYGERHHNLAPDVTIPLP